MLSALMPDSRAMWLERYQALAGTGVRSPAAVRSGVGAVSPAQVDAVAAVGAAVVGDGQLVSRAPPS